MKDKLGVIEKQAADRIKEDTIKWAKGLMYLYGVALGILLVALSLFGIKQFSDLDKSFANVQDHLNRIEKTVQDKTADLLKALDRQIEDADKKLTGLRTSLSTLSSGVDEEQKHLNELKTVASTMKFDKTIEELRSTVSMKMKDIDKLRINLEKGIRGVKQVQKDQTQFDHSLFDIHLQFDGGPEQTQGSMESFLQPLSEQGFIIEEANILRISVDKSEVIYYNRLARMQTRLIANTLKPYFPTITTRFSDRKERNAREILIKLVKH